MNNFDTDELIIEEFKKRRIRQYIITIPVVIALIFLILSKDSEWFSQLEMVQTYENYFVGVALGLVVVSLIFSLINWRCPKCNTYIGKKMFPKFCSKCGQKLV